MRWVVDASVVLKWYVPEADSQSAVKWLYAAGEGKAKLVAPDLIRVEMADVLWRKYRSKELSLAEVRAIVRAIAENLPVQVVENQVLVPGALEIAAACNITVYDGLYLALAVATEAKLVTADMKLFDSVQGTAYQDVVRTILS